MIFLTLNLKFFSPYIFYDCLFLLADFILIQAAMVFLNV